MADGCRPGSSAIPLHICICHLSDRNGDGTDLCTSYLRRLPAVHMRGRRWCWIIASPHAGRTSSCSRRRRRDLVVHALVHFDRPVHGGGGGRSGRRTDEQMNMKMNRQWITCSKLEVQWYHMAGQVQLVFLVELNGCGHLITAGRKMGCCSIGTSDEWYIFVHD